MAGTRYDVEARLELKNTAKAQADAKKVSDEIFRLGERIRGVQNPAAGMVRSLVGIGAAYLGVSAIGGAMVRATKGAFGFQAELERTKIGLASVLSATQGYDFATGLKEGEKIFKELSDDAIKSTATTKELFDIYQSVVGPISAAGKSLSVVRSITNDTVSAASALGVDFNQASRDVNMMVRGTAGVDVKLFSMLKSTGAIKEDAKTFNALTASARIEKIQAALAKFAPAAAAYGKSWAGVTSSFTDIVQQLSASAFGPAFESIKGFIGGINDRLLAHREAISAFMTRIGTVLGKMLDKTFARATAGVDYVIEHWSEINAKIRDTIDKVKELIPKLAAAAKGFAALQIAQGVAPTALSGVGYLAKGMGGAGLLGGGAGAAATGGAAAGAAAFGPLGGALLAIGAIAAAVGEQFAPLSAVFEASFMPLGTELMGLAKAVGTFLFPILKMFGHVLVLGLGPALSVVANAATALIGGLRIVFEWLSKWSNLLYEKMRPAIDAAYVAFKKVAELLGGFVSSILGKGPSSFIPRQVQQGLPLQDGRLLVENKPAFRMGGEQFDMFQQPEAKRTKPQVVNDFRGSKIEVHQQFKDADPDRVLIQMVDDLNRQAEMRLRSGYAPALAGA